MEMERRILQRVLPRFLFERIDTQGFRWQNYHYRIETDYNPWKGLHINGTLGLYRHGTPLVMGPFSDVGSRMLWLYKSRVDQYKIAVQRFYHRAFSYYDISIEYRISF